MPLTPTETRTLLTSLGHMPKRFLGQNFLVDGNIVRKSLELAEVKAGDRIVEIGPGLGTLTSALLQTGAEVWAVEKDRTLHAHVASTLLPAYPGTFHLVEGDAMDLPRAALPDELAQRGFKIVANLPYAISTPWMDAILEGPLPERLVLMLQREAADRYVARHGVKAFGAISIFLQASFTIAPGHKVSAACFHPRPDVDSYLLHLVKKAQSVVFTPETKAVIRACFQQRRKQIGALLRERLPDQGAHWLEVLTASGLSPMSRPEQIPWELWAHLQV